MADEEKTPLEWAQEETDAALDIYYDGVEGLFSDKAQLALTLSAYAQAEALTRIADALEGLISAGSEELPPMLNVAALVRQL